ncbi:hypothetical protein QBC42DRAFT_265155 [Cladorrhinum samala]|uniref:Uncharacterized protein n=1 Tax=Cladorrhinum samala TaxID=585594 RepID=A0AAV9HVD2_9PEZI|nr:hypothetical protein QBC42DRAFT_265155 [Cladorrhinum samala]
MISFQMETPGSFNEPFSDFILFPFHNLRIRARIAASPFYSIKIRLAASSLISHIEDVLTKLEPLCIQLFDEHGTGFTNALEKNPELVGYRDELDKVVAELQTSTPRIEEIERARRVVWRAGLGFQAAVEDIRMGMLQTIGSKGNKPEGEKSVVTATCGGPVLELERLSMAENSHNKPAVSLRDILVLVTEKNGNGDLDSECDNDSIKGDPSLVSPLTPDEDDGFRGRYNEGYENRKVGGKELGCERYSGDHGSTGVEVELTTSATHRVVLRGEGHAVMDTQHGGMTGPLTGNRSRGLYIPSPTSVNPCAKQHEAITFQSAFMASRSSPNCSQTRSPSPSQQPGSTGSEKRGRFWDRLKGSMIEAQEKNKAKVSRGGPNYY